MDLQTAKEHLKKGSYTCVLCLDGQIATSTYRGVKPLLSWLEDPALGKGFSAADKVVGKATAYLYILLGAKAVHAGVMSQSALQVLKDGNIAVSYDTLVPYIVNRAGDGMCPMEAATQNARTPQEALFAIKNTLAKLDKRV